MNDNFNQENLVNDNELDLKDLFSIILQRKKLVLSIFVAISFASLLFALFSPNVYRSHSILAPTSQEDSLSSMLGSYSSLAGIAGISLPSEPANKSVEAIERIISFNFFSNYFLPNIKLENLFASKGWDQLEDKIIYDDNIFDSYKNKWVRDEDFPKKAKPSEQEAYEVYLEIIKISEDNNTGFVKLSIDSYSPNIAQKWLEIIIYNINESMRLEDKELTLDYINYLNQAFKETTQSEIRESITQLLQVQMQKFMVTEYSKDYIFKYIEQPLAPEEEDSPNRMLIVILGSFFGFIVSSFVSVILHFRANFKI